MTAAVGTMLDVVEYDKLVEVVQSLSVAEDFNPYIKSNFHVQDRNELWYNTYAETKIDYCPNLEAKLRPNQTTLDPKRIAISNLIVEDYWNRLNDTENKIYRLTEYGHTQKRSCRKTRLCWKQRSVKTAPKMRMKFRDATGI